MSKQKLIYIMSAVFVCILFAAVGFFIYDLYMEHNFVPPVESVRIPIPETTMPPREDRVEPLPPPVQEPDNENDDANEEPEYVPPPPRELLPRVVQLREYYNNPDVVGYLHIPNTNISYPVVQTGNNIFYLDHNIRMQPDRRGAVFVDYENNIYELWDDNMLIYGHNTANGTKFHNIRHFHNANYFNQRRHIYLTTPYKETVWETFSFFPTTTEFCYLTTNFPTLDMFYEFMLDLQSRSIHTTDVVLTRNCQILILSTCATNNRARINRYILIARLVR